MPLNDANTAFLTELAESGVNYLAVLPFTPALAAFPAEEFVERVLSQLFPQRPVSVLDS